MMKRGVGGLLPVEGRSWRVAAADRSRKNAAAFVVLGLLLVVTSVGWEKARSQGTASGAAQAKRSKCWSPPRT
ncbi:MAG: hypothetical protein U0792_04520 [Gemmataceae bacterium]